MAGKGLKMAFGEKGRADRRGLFLPGGTSGAEKWLGVSGAAGVKFPVNRA